MQKLRFLIDRVINLGPCILKIYINIDFIKLICNFIVFRYLSTVDNANNEVAAKPFDEIPSPRGTTAKIAVP